jgi:hypothetical protein
MAFKPDEPPVSRGRFVPDTEPITPSAEERVGVITERGEAQRRAGLTQEQRLAEDQTAATRPKVQPISPLQTAMQTAAAVPVLGAGARLAQLASRGSRVAPYAGRLSELLLPRTGRQLMERGSLAALGGAGAQAVSNVLPEDTSPLARQAIEFGTGMAIEGAAGGLKQAAKAFRPILPNGVQRAGERVVRQLQPEVIETLPEARASKSQILRSMQERLRGKPVGEGVDVSDVARLLGVEAAATRERGTQLGKQLAAGTERRLADISRPRTATEVGEEARDIANTRLQQLKGVRDQQAKTDLDEIKTIVQTKEQAGQGIEGTKAFAAAKQALKDKLIDPLSKRVSLTGPEAAAVAEVRRDLTGTILDPITGETTQKKLSFAALENLRRRLGDRAAGAPATGYEAIGQQQAKELKELVENVMDEFSGGKFKTYLGNYKKNSEPINQFEIKLGRKLTGTLERPIGEFEVDPITLPKSIFSSARNVDDFIELVGGDKTAVERLARNYVSEQLAGKTPKQIEQFLTTNKGWLQKFPVVRDDFAAYAKKAAQEARVQPKLQARTEARASRFELGRMPSEQVENFRGLIKGSGRIEDVVAAGRVLNQTPEGRTAFRSALQEVLGTEPAGSLERVFRDRIRPAMQASGVYTPEQLKTVEDSVRDIVAVQTRIEQAISRASQIPGAETDASQLTRLINEEVADMKRGGAALGVMTGGILAALSRFDLPTPSLGQLGVTGGVGAALFGNAYRQYNARIRQAVSDIVTDPAKLDRVLKAPPQSRDGVVAAMIRQGIATGMAEAPERVEEDATR